jgi:hypothetical protein
MILFKTTLRVEVKGVCWNGWGVFNVSIPWKTPACLVVAFI